jgi:hypothetical protein
LAVTARTSLSVVGTSLLHLHRLYAVFSAAAACRPINFTAISRWRDVWVAGQAAQNRIIILIKSLKESIHRAVECEQGGRNRQAGTLSGSRPFPFHLSLEKNADTTPTGVTIPPLALPTRRNKTMTYFINTDAKSNEGRSYHDEWMARGIAATSGPSQFRRKLARLGRGDVVLMYANRLGAVAAGVVLDDDVVTVSPPDCISPREPYEYHRRVRWCRLPTPISPATLAALSGRPPRQTVERVAHGEDELRALLPAELFSPGETE